MKLLKDYEKKMTIKDQFKILTTFFKNKGFDYAVVGAFALYAYGYMRATKDIDFIVRAECQKSIIDYLESLGFETLHCSKGYSNHLHPIGAVRIDLVYVSAETADIIFASTQEKNVADDIKLPVVSPEHLIALKLFAVKNDPDRKFKELSDIKEICRLADISDEAILAYFKKYGLERYYYELTVKKDA